MALGVGVPANEAGLSGNQPPILGKSVTDFWEMRHRFWEMRHRFWGNPSPILRKSITDFGEIRYRFWEMLRFWGKTCSVLGKTGSDSVFGKNTVSVFGENFAKNRFGLGGNWLGFWIGLGQSSSLTVLNAKHVWVWIFEVLGLGVSKNKSTGGKLEG